MLLFGEDQVESNCNNVTVTINGWNAQVIFIHATWPRPLQMAVEALSSQRAGLGSLVRLFNVLLLTKQLCCQNRRVEIHFLSKLRGIEVTMTKLSPSDSSPVVGYTPVQTVCTPKCRRTDLLVSILALLLWKRHFSSWEAWVSYLYCRVNVEPWLGVLVCRLLQKAHIPHLWVIWEADLKDTMKYKYKLERLCMCKYIFSPCLQTGQNSIF